jgi:hypothetical protein
MASVAEYRPIIEAVANLLISDGSVTVQLSDWEKAEALHGDMTFPRSAITGVRVVSSSADEVPGMKLIGSGIPGALKVGTWADGKTGRTFAACHGNGPGLVIDLAGEHYDRVVMTLDNAEVLAGQLS